LPASGQSHHSEGKKQDTGFPTVTAQGFGADSDSQTALLDGISKKYTQMYLFVRF
jgi:hypothetical protein